MDVHELLRSTLLVTEWDHELPEICCYAGDLNQVWTNLNENAIEAMNGQGSLTVRTMRGGHAMICVEIRDDGPGIANDIIDHIFTAFFTTKPVGEGSGLGLDLAWRIVENHGGNLSVQSVPGDRVSRYVCRCSRPFSPSR